MTEQLNMSINGQKIIVAEGISVASALLTNNIWSFRKSITGKSRMPLCGMGICFECRVTVNQHQHQRACMIICKDNMEITTDE